MRHERGSRPHVICHIFASIDGRIDGPYMFDPASLGSRGAYGELREGLDADATAYGTVTTRGFIGSGLPRTDPGAAVPEGDFVADGASEASSYYVSLDPEGTLAWDSATFRRPGRGDAHVVELLARSTPAPYRAYLRERGISYVVTGERELDLPLACEKLRQLFGIERLLVCGGGIADAAFLSAGLIDELSVVFAPVASGERDVATIFDEAPFAPSSPRPFRLERTERVAGDGLHVVWVRS